jgi:hypothetical protein
MHCRKILAVADTYIAYSVTQKRNLLRLIDSTTGEKCILRGHEGSIADLTVSNVDQGFFASVDNMENSSLSHTFIWKRGTKNIDFSKLVELPLRGVMILSHPIQENIWCVCNGKQFVLFSINLLPTNDNITYSSFSMNYDAGNSQITSMLVSFYVCLLLFLVVFLPFLFFVCFSHVS